MDPELLIHRDIVPVCLGLLPSCAEPSASRCHGGMHLNITGKGRGGASCGLGSWWRVCWRTCRNVWVLLPQENPLYTPSPPSFLFQKSHHSSLFQMRRTTTEELLWISWRRPTNRKKYLFIKCYIKGEVSRLGSCRGESRWRYARREKSVKDLKPGAAPLLPFSHDSPTCSLEKPIITRASIVSFHFLSLYTERNSRSVS